MRFVGDDDEGVVSSTQYPQFDLLGFLTERQIDYKQQDAADHSEVTFNCPKCVERGEPRSDTKKRLWVNTRSGFFICYNCDWRGSLPKLVSGLANTSFEGALKILRGALLDPMEHLDLRLFEEPVERDDEDASIPDCDLPHGYEPIEGPHPYLEKRGIPWEYAARHDWGLGTVGYTKDRIIVPMFMDTRLVFWQARATWESTGSDHKKVLNPSGRSARHVLYNYDVAKEFETVILVEGFIDAVKVGDDAMATNGKRLHARQIEALRKTKAREVVILWDLDAWTDRKRNSRTGVTRPASVEAAAGLLKMFFKVRGARLPKGRDPGSYDYKSAELREIIERAKPIRAGDFDIET